MGRIKTTTLSSLIVCMTSLLHAQSQDSLMTFYPLEIGNIWQYEDQTLGEIETHRIIGDTLINNHRFFVFHVTWSNPSIPESFYYRTVNDSLWVIDYSKDENSGVFRESIKYKLGASVGESWEVQPGFPTTLDSIGTYQAFNLSRNALYFGVFNGFFTHQEVLAESLGFVVRLGQAEVSTTIIVGALINGQLYGTITGVQNPHNAAPDNFRLYQNYPNPFNQSTVIPFRIGRLSRVTLELYTIKGDLIRLLFNDVVPSGDYTVTWDGTNNHGRPVSSGSYFVRMANNHGQSVVRKILLIK